MRILALAHRYLPEHNAGAETTLHALLRALVARGHDVVVHLSRQEGQSYELNGVHVLAGAAAGDTARAAAGADALVAHLETTPAATRLGAWNNRPVVLVHHNNLPVTKHALSVGRVDLVVANSRWMQQDLIDHLDGATSRPRVIVVRPLVHSAAYATVSPDADRVTLVNLRRMERSPSGAVMGKGAEVFWALAERMPDMRFLGVKGAYGGQLVRDLPNVDVLEQVPHDQMRDRVYARTRVLLMPSSYESWGRVGVEALCSGIPVIAHPTPGLRESLGAAGIFVDRSDLDGWEDTLRELADSVRYRAASQRALIRAAQLDPTEDLDRWCDAVEATARKPVGAR